MKKASQAFAGGTLPPKFGAVTGVAPIPNALRDVAMVFVDLQQARHEADYNLAKRFTRRQAKTLIDRAAQAFQDWQAVRGSDHARLYLACLLLWDRWEKVK